jgi:hypothetical protein
MNAPITFDFVFLATFVITLIAVLIAFYAGFGLLAALRPHQVPQGGNSPRRPG